MVFDLSTSFKPVSWVNLQSLLREVSLGFWFPSPLLHRCFSNRLFVCVLSRSLYSRVLTSTDIICIDGRRSFHKWRAKLAKIICRCWLKQFFFFCYWASLPSLARVLSTCLYNGRSHVKSGNKTHFDWISKVSIASEPWPLIAAILQHPHPPCCSCQTAKVLLNV